MSDSRVGTIPATSLSRNFIAAQLRHQIGALLPKPDDGVSDAFDCDDLQAVDFLLRLVGLRDDRAGEAELGGLFQSLLAARRGAHFAGESACAEYGELLGGRIVG